MDVWAIKNDVRAKVVEELLNRETLGLWGTVKELDLEIGVHQDFY